MRIAPRLGIGLLGAVFLVPACAAREDFVTRAPAARPSTDADAGRNANPTDAAPPLTLNGVIPEPEDDTATLFDQTVVRTYELTVEPEDLAYIDQNPPAEEYVRGELRLGDETYGPIGVRYKGSYGAFLPPCTATSYIATEPTGPKTGKCSMKIAFDYADPEGRFHGVKKLNFHSMNGDRSMLRERLGYELFRENGVAAPRAMHARLVINGVFQGLFVVVEQIDGRFTRSRFDEGGKGNLYKEVWPMFDDEATYLAALESNKDEGISAAPMVALKNAVANGSGAAERLIDRDYTLRYLAADRVLINDDGAAHWWCTTGGQGNNPGGIGNHNYYWYQAGDLSKLWIVPWDLDSSLNSSPFVRVSPEWRTTAPCECGGFPLGQRPTSCDRLYSLWGSWRADYESAVDAFIRGPFAKEPVDLAVAAYANQIAGIVAEAAGVQGAPSVEAWQASVESLKATLDAARANRGAPY